MKGWYLKNYQMHKLSDTFSIKNLLEIHKIHFLPNLLHIVDCTVLNYVSERNAMGNNILPTTGHDCYKKREKSEKGSISSTSYLHDGSATKGCN